MKNTGKLDGKEVVQVYIDDVLSSVVVPNKALKGFKKISIDAGEQKKVKIPIKLEDLQVWNYDNEWELEKGDFNVFVGGSYSELTLNATFTVV